MHPFDASVQPLASPFPPASRPFFVPSSHLLLAASSVPPSCCVLSASRVPVTFREATQFVHTDRSRRSASRPDLAPARNCTSASAFAFCAPSFSAVCMSPLANRPSVRSAISKPISQAAVSAMHCPCQGSASVTAFEQRSPMPATSDRGKGLAARLGDWRHALTISRVEQHGKARMSNKRRTLTTHLAATLNRSPRLQGRMWRSRLPGARLPSPPGYQWQGLGPSFIRSDTA